MREGRLFDEFAFYALKYEDHDIVEVFNKYIRLVDGEERNYVSEHYILFLRTGEAARNAPEQIQELLIRKVCANNNRETKK